MDWASPAAAALFGWLARHPPLRRVCFTTLNIPSAFDSHHFAAHVVQLCRCRPDLLVYCCGPNTDAFKDASFFALLDNE
jgi:hypothetical protein